MTSPLANHPPRRPVRVLQSYREPRPTTNPYITTLTSMLRREQGLSVQTFTFGRALIGRYDVVHVHWPEVVMSGHRRSGRVARQILTALFVTRLAITRTPVVRTVHNLELPTGLSRAQRWLLGRFDALTVLRIALNDQTVRLVEGPTEVILHGDYRERYAEPRPATRPGENRLRRSGAALQGGRAARRRLQVLTRR